VIDEMLDFPKDGLVVLISRLKGEAIRTPSDSWSLILGHVYFVNEDYEDAINWYGKAFEVDASAYRASVIFDTYEKMGYYVEALEWIDTAMSLGDNSIEMRQIRANMFANLCDLDEAIAQYSKLIEHDPDMSDLYSRRGYYYYNSKRYNEALKDFEMTLSLDPDQMDVHLRMGYIYLKIGEKSKAEKELKKTLDMMRESDNYYLAMFVYHALGDNAKAQEAVADVLREYPTSGGVLYNVACYYSISGDTKNALSYLAKALENGYRRFGEIRIDIHLDNIKSLDEFEILMLKYEPQNAKRKVSETLGKDIASF
jgi:tetratricopeptide (TPR) repeat protein